MIMSVFLESFLGSFMGLVVGGGMLMLFGFLMTKRMVRTIMTEVWNTAAERVTSAVSGKKNK